MTKYINQTRLVSVFRAASVFIISIFSSSIMSNDLSYCSDPLVFRSGMENVFDCNESPSYDLSVAQFRAAFAENNPLGFCIQETVISGVSICSSPCTEGSANGCLGTFQTPGLIVNASEGMICGNYMFEVPTLDMHYVSVDCEASLNATGDLVMAVDSTYTGPLTWEITGGTASISNVESNVGSGCGPLGALLDSVLPLIEGYVVTAIEAELENTLGSLSGVGVCPVDSLSDNLILP